MITSKAFTIETRLNQKDNAEIIEYAKEYSVLYGKMIRFTWHRIKNGGQLPIKKSDFNTLLQKTFGVNKRVANSVIYEIVGIYKSLYQLSNQFASKRAISLDSPLRSIVPFDSLISFSMLLAKQFSPMPHTSRVSVWIPVAS